MNSNIILLSLFFCHFLADFTPLSTVWMLKAKRFGKPLTPIFAHGLVHGTLMAFALSLLTKDQNLVGRLMILQTVSHFIIDVWKGKMTARFPIFQYNMKHPYWILMGFDQFLHATVIILMVQILQS